jgi:hypothetical protein
MRAIKAARVESSCDSTAGLVVQCDENTVPTLRCAVYVSHVKIS